MNLFELDDFLFLFQSVSRREREDLLTTLAAKSAEIAPEPFEEYTRVDRYTPLGCSDETVLYSRVANNTGIEFRMTFGPTTKILVKSVCYILCVSFNREKPISLLELEPHIFDRLVGSDLARMRSQTLTSILDTMQRAAESLASPYGS